MEIQQSPLYASYIRSLRWVVIGKPGSYLYIKKIPFLGGILKIQRVTSLPEVKTLIPVIKIYGIRTLAVEPDSRISGKLLNRFISTLPESVRINSDYFLPTKTIQVGVTESEEIIFGTFTEAKRRAVRKAQKNGVTVSESRDIHLFMKLKNKTAGLFGSITTYGIDKLWPLFAPEHAAILLARNSSGVPIGGILLLFWGGIAYYWIAGATQEGKKLFAPTLLVWEALKLAKNKKCTLLDFVGVWDERLPSKNDKWKGFTKFKEGFGGTPLYYPLISKG